MRQTAKYLIVCAWIGLGMAAGPGPAALAQPPESYSFEKDADMDERPDSFTILIALAGRGELYYGSGLRQSVPVATGETILLPAALGRWQVEAAATVRLLRVRLPVA